jgi:hypothetical protein
VKLARDPRVGGASGQHSQHNLGIIFSHAKNITHTWSSPTSFLGIQGFIGLNSQQSNEEIPIDPLHQENFSFLTYFLTNLQHYSKCPPSSTTHYFIQPCH